MSGKQLHYGIADRAWQPVVGCDPHMPCAPRCWARRTMARVVECQKPVSPERAEFYRIALTPDGAKWSGEVLLDEAHLMDPLGWKNPALIATGFHGDWGRLKEDDKDRVLGVMALCQQHRFMSLTKQPADLLQYLTCQLPLSSREDIVMAHAAHSGSVVWDARGSERVNYFGCARLGDISNRRAWPGFPLPNVSIGCSVMNQSEADKMREPMAAIAARDWNTHVWYEPALGPVNWLGWGFLGGIIAGGESGKDSRPSHPQWHRDTRDWCVANHVPFRFKQWGSWSPCSCDGAGCGPRCRRISASGRDVTPNMDWWSESDVSMRPVHKRDAGRLLDAREWNDVPRFGKVEVLHHAR